MPAKLPPAGSRLDAFRALSPGFSDTAAAQGALERTQETRRQVVAILVGVLAVWLRHPSPPGQRLAARRSDEHPQPMGTAEGNVASSQNQSEQPLAEDASDSRHVMLVSTAGQKPAFIEERLRGTSLIVRAKSVRFTALGHQKGRVTRVVYGTLPEPLSPDGLIDVLPFSQAILDRWIETPGNPSPEWVAQHMWDFYQGHTAGDDRLFFVDQMRKTEDGWVYHLADSRGYRWGGAPSLDPLEADVVRLLRTGTYLDLDLHKFVRSTPGELEVHLGIILDDVGEALLSDGDAPHIVHSISQR